MSKNNNFTYHVQEACGHGIVVVQQPANAGL